MRRGAQRRGLSSFTPPPERALFAGVNRDSDVSSLASSRPSSAAAPYPITDRSNQAAAIRSINAYLSSHSVQFSLKPPLPSARDITDTLRFVLSGLQWPISDASRLEDELLPLLKQLGCPFKINKSALKAPGTPHSWPSLLAVIFWLVQLARYSDYLSSSTADSTSFFTGNAPNQYAFISYSHFIEGDDDAVSNLDEDYDGKVQQELANSTKRLELLQQEAVDLELKLQAMRSEPSRKEALEKKKSELMQDVGKFNEVVGTFQAKVASAESVLKEKEEELEAKIRENKRICQENEELRSKIGSQSINVRDMEWMKKELQAVESDIAEAENGRHSFEEKSWELESAIRRKYKELEALLDQCNQAIKKLKLAIEFQYVLNPKGSSPAEVIGINYKTVLKPALSALSHDTKKSSVAKQEESTALQKQSQKNAIMLEEKRKSLNALQARIDEAEARSNLLRKEIENHAFRCEEEAGRARAEVEARAYQLDIVEREAEELLKNSEQKLQNAMTESEKEIQMCAHELWSLIDEVSEYYEFTESTISGMKSELSNTVQAVAETYRATTSQKAASSGSKGSQIP